jgi:hypothetical protein
MRYTLSNGYDRQIKQRVEKGTLFVVPLTLLAIVGLAALTSNTTSGPGLGSPSSGVGGTSSVTRTFNIGKDQLANASTMGAQGSTSSARSTTTKATSSTGSSSSSATLPSTSQTAGALQSTPTPTTSTGGTTTPTPTVTNPLPSGGATDPSDCVCEVLAPVVEPVTAPLTNVVDPVTSSLGL